MQNWTLKPKMYFRYNLDPKILKNEVLPLLNKMSMMLGDF